MADPNMTNSNSNPNQTMRSEQAKAEVSGGDRQRKQGTDKNANEKSAIGGGGERSQTGEQGRARNELDQNKGQSRQNSEFDKSRSETAGQR